MCEGSSISTSLPTPVIICLFVYSHPSWYEVLHSFFLIARDMQNMINFKVLEYGDNSISSNVFLRAQVCPGQRSSWPLPS